MQRVIPVGPLPRQPRGEQPIRLDHHFRVARLHRENELVKLQAARDAGKLQRALDHAERRVAVAVHDAIAERAVVRADAHGDAARLAQLDQRGEALPDSLELRQILLVAVFTHRELFRVGVVAGIDAHFFHPPSRLHRRVGLEVNVRDERHAATALEQASLDVLQIPRVLHRRRGDAHDLAADRGQLERLCDGCLRVHRVACDHRLDANRIEAADGDISHAHHARWAAEKNERIERRLHLPFGTASAAGAANSSVSRLFIHGRSCTS